MTAWRRGSAAPPRVRPRRAQVRPEVAAVTSHDDGLVHFVRPAMRPGPSVTVGCGQAAPATPRPSPASLIITAPVCTKCAVQRRAVGLVSPSIPGMLSVSLFENVEIILFANSSCAGPPDRNSRPAWRGATPWSAAQRRQAQLSDGMDRNSRCGRARQGAAGRGLSAKL